ncbi:MAG: hypothetical protein UW94_C0014G0047 [Parcubacteria group bacterium GW2011_GWA2_45_14]|nr:MAG: hypothetical protein UW94_C0014G0047 [Parcubacteria group bacterium GW2011_GWA2_45_14]
MDIQQLFAVGDDYTIVGLDNIVVEFIIRLVVNSHPEHAWFTGAVVEKALLVELAAPKNKEVTESVSGIFW